MPTTLGPTDKNHIWELYRKYGTVDAVAIELGMAREEIGPVIDEMPLRQLYRRRGSPPPAYDRESLAKALKDAAKVCGEPLTLPAYRQEAAKHGWPAAHTITKEFDTWEAACDYAKVKANPSIGPRKGSYTVEDCLVALRICRSDLIDREELDADGAPSYERYCKWARETGQPSGPTVRNKIGAWREAIRLAYK
jgi:hypothetical protein